MLASKPSSVARHGEKGDTHTADTHVLFFGLPGISCRVLPLGNLIMVALHLVSMHNYAPKAKAVM